MLSHSPNSELAENWLVNHWEEGRVFFVDGLSHNYNSKTHAGFRVVELLDTGQLNTLLCLPCHQPCSAHLAELKALTDACLIATEDVTIYTYRAYAHNVCHIHGAQWKQGGFKKSNVSLIQHLDPPLGCSDVS